MHRFIQFYVLFAIISAIFTNFYKEIYYRWRVATTGPTDGAANFLRRWAFVDKKYRCFGLGKIMNDNQLIFIVKKNMRQDKFF